MPTATPPDAELLDDLLSNPNDWPGGTTVLVDGRHYDDGLDQLRDLAALQRHYCVRQLRLTDNFDAPPLFPPGVLDATPVVIEPPTLDAADLAYAEHEGNRFYHGDLRFEAAAHNLPRSIPGDSDSDRDRPVLTDLVVGAAGIETRGRVRVTRDVAPADGPLVFGLTLARPGYLHLPEAGAGRSRLLHGDAALYVKAPETAAYTKYDSEVLATFDVTDALQRAFDEAPERWDEEGPIAG